MDGPDTAGREHDEGEIWRDLVSRLDGQAGYEDAGQAAPWPAEENLDASPLGARVIKPADPDALDGEPVTARPGEPPATPPRRRRLYLVPNQPQRKVVPRKICTRAHAIR